MKCFLICCLLLVGVGVPQVCAQGDAGEKHPILRGLIDAGAKAVQKHVENRQKGKNGGRVSQQQQQQLQGGAADGVQGQTRVLVSQLVEAALGDSLYNVKEQVKEEGRSYARQFGDVVAERLLADKRVQEAMRLLKILAGVIISYLTLVTVALLRGLSQVKKQQQRVLELLQEGRRGR
ncbi:MAG: hypothetical protein J1E42_08910 [Akkermansiaceae bacterium]|nr:hypothetical protein [Akkermansiaceae bacterium]